MSKGLIAKGRWGEVSSIFEAIENDIGLFFPDEVDGNYQRWMAEFTPEEVRRASFKMKSMLFGKVAHLPLICPGVSKCVYKHTCPFDGKEPVGKGCPVESAFVIEKLNGYRKELMIDSFKESEYLLVCRLIELELYDTRISALMRTPEHSDVVKTVFAGASPRGESFFKEEENPLYSIKNKINQEKGKILAVLVETPEARYKKAAALKQSGDDVYSKEMQKIEEMVRDIETRLLDNKDKPEEESKS